MAITDYLDLVREVLVLDHLAPSFSVAIFNLSFLTHRANFVVAVVLVLFLQNDALNVRDSCKLFYRKLENDEFWRQRRRRTLGAELDDQVELIQPNHAKETFASFTSSMAQMKRIVDLWSKNGPTNFFPQQRLLRLEYAAKHSLHSSPIHSALEVLDLAS